MTGDKEQLDSETFKYHGKALAEIWIGRAAINAGSLTGERLRSIIVD